MDWPTGAEMPNSGNRRAVYLHRWSLIAAAAAFAAFAVRIDACTLWGVVVTNGTGGTILCKNRDWAPDHTQALKLVRPSKGYAYYGLFAVGGSEPGIKAGVNERGLVVVTAAASCIPKSRRERQPGKHGVLTKLLSSYASCDELLAKKDEIFSGARAMFIFVADREKLLEAEVGLGGAYAVKPVASGFAAHTNHYLDPSLTAFNESVGESSRARLARVTELLGARSLYSLEVCAAISRDRRGGPDNSLWRTGKGVRTLASWVVETPRNGPPRVRAVLANPGQPEETRSVVLDAAFWRGGR